MEYEIVHVSHTMLDVRGLPAAAPPLASREATARWSGRLGGRSRAHALDRQPRSALQSSSRRPFYVPGVAAVCRTAPGSFCRDGGKPRTVRSAPTRCSLPAMVSGRASARADRMRKSPQLLGVFRDLLVARCPGGHRDVAVCGRSLRRSGSLAGHGCCPGTAAVTSARSRS